MKMLSKAINLIDESSSRGADLCEGVPMVGIFFMLASIPSLLVLCLFGLMDMLFERLGNK